jgi:hypothetical protein
LRGGCRGDGARPATSSSRTRFRPPSSTVCGRRRRRSRRCSRRCPRSARRPCRPCTTSFRTWTWTRR